MLSFLKELELGRFLDFMELTSVLVSAQSVFGSNVSSWHRSYRTPTQHYKENYQGNHKKNRVKIPILFPDTFLIIFFLRLCGQTVKLKVIHNLSIYMLMLDPFFIFLHFLRTNNDWFSMLKLKTLVCFQLQPSFINVCWTIIWHLLS